MSLGSLSLAVFATCLCLGVNVLGGSSSPVIPAVNVDFYNPKGRPSGATLKKVGAEWIRVEFKVYTTVEAAFKIYDSNITGIKAAGIKVLMILDYDAAHGKPKFSAPASEWEAYGKKYVAVVKQVYDHYHEIGTDVDAFEIWNEPDLAHGSPAYDPRYPQASYGTMLKLLYQTIKPGTNPPSAAATSLDTSDAIVIVMGGLASGDPAWLSKVSEAAGGLWVDAVGVHPYGRRPWPNWPTPTWGFGTLIDLMGQYYNYVAKQPFGKRPMWITEYGTNLKDVEGYFPDKAFTAINHFQFSDKCPILFWFCWSDGMVPGFGLVNAEDQPKMAYSSFQTYSNSTH